MSEKTEFLNKLLGGRYKIIRSLGSGGMAIVYQAKDIMLERLVAIKVLKKDFTELPSFREQFKNEARSAANLSHPNIVTVHDFGFDHERFFIVMEYVPGQNLKVKIKTVKTFTLEEGIPLIVQACAGIGYAHRAGLIHCDVKPHNMLVTPDERLKVTDFGIARVLSSISSEERKEVIWGSPQYLSPEQASGKAPSPSSDVYSIGVILYEMLTGGLPFKSKDAEELVRMHKELNPIPPIELNKEIPPELNQIIMKVLSKEPASRYRTSDQLGRILLNFYRQKDPYKKINSPYKRVQMPQTAPLITQPDPLPLDNPEVPEENISLSDREEDNTPSIDWISIGLGLLAIITVIGLIPFWLYVWFNLPINTPLP
ncbi:MAG: serine/threonine protein kinase [Bacteroidales bacterium]|nr:serine/threonine protein kinase [Bacteroidales bacterium]